jgi:rSAM/selenodomain-associated transferase 1
VNILGLFARYPEPGKTKTRLAATIGDQAAVDLYACFVRDLVSRLGQFTDQFWIASTPDSPKANEWFQSLATTQHEARPELLTQPEGDLGQRIDWFFRKAAAQNAGPAILIGTDNPDLPSSRITQAFELLNDGTADVVTVPAADGGYVLIGMAGKPGSLFDRIRWSSPFTLLDTIKAVDSAGLRLSVLPPWYDVDHVENLGTLAALQQHPGQTEAASCPLTADYLKRFLEEFGEG